MDKFSSKFPRTSEAASDSNAEAFGTPGATDLEILGELELMLASGGDSVPSWG